MSPVDSTHVGVPGNEAADELAGRGHYLPAVASVFLQDIFHYLELYHVYACCSMFNKYSQDKNLPLRPLLVAKKKRLHQVAPYTTLEPHEVIESFSPTSENYEKAIEALKNRFGREELLIEFYVRELLALVIQNATKRRDQLSICGKIPRLKRGLWNKELREKKIWITDYGEGSLEIELLIGVDFCGQLFTGLVHKLECGLIACET
ncbi:uncharacterized protein TNCV_4151881 [Trichonephila clavipes]|nr:uncharacterized protein TNCV_4151881 [Trichonephila clavipes]